MNERTPSTYKETPYTYKKLQLVSLSSQASLMPTTVLATKNVPSLQALSYEGSTHWNPHSQKRFVWPMQDPKNRESVAYKSRLLAFS